MLPIKVTTSNANSGEYPKVDELISKPNREGKEIMEERYGIPPNQQFHMSVNRQKYFYLNNHVYAYPAYHVV